MTVWELIIWFISAAITSVALYFVLYPVRKSDRWWVHFISAVLKAVAGTGAAFLIIAASFATPLVPSLILILLSVILWGDAAADIIVMVICLITERSPSMKTSLILSFVIVMAYFTYSVINMQIVTGKEHVYTSDKISEDHKFVFVTDIHYGSAQLLSVTEKMLSDIKAEDPEFIVLGGDITDEFTTREEMEYIYSKLGTLDIPVYFIYGNHDRQGYADTYGGRTYTDEELADALESNGIRVLHDEYVIIDDELLLMGREDPTDDSRLAVTDLPERPEELYVINIEHNPYQYDDILDTHADLQLSGHVHAGQIFPLRTVYKLGVHNIYGDSRSGNTDIYVTSGASGWCAPLRSEAHCNYEVVTVCSSHNRT